MANGSTSHRIMKKRQYYGPQTKQALKNFPFPNHKVHLELIYAIVEIKKAAARANTKAGILDKQKAGAIAKACSEILKGKFDDQFVTISLQGGAGTSINMNVNEVIASRASEILHNKGQKTVVHPNDHVNMSQSTNDVNPSALKITCLRLTDELETSLDYLISTFEQKTKEFKQVYKLGRTHLQDAVPTTLGEEFAAYASIIKRDKKRIQEAEKFLYGLGLGGTAIGNRINAPAEYIENVYKELKRITRLPLRQADNLMSQTGFQSDFCHLSSVVTILCLDLSKIATDLRILASGPKGGLAEITLGELQPGSSIMPGKVNPVIPESINQVYYFVLGKNQTIHQGARDSSLELALMFPIVADSIITSLKVVESAVRNFAERCISKVIANEKRCKELLERSTAYATLLTPRLGYDTVSTIVKEAVEENKTIREITLGRKLLTKKGFDEIVQI